jgi:hypothetical protein
MSNYFRTLATPVDNPPNADKIFIKFPPDQNVRVYFNIIHEDPVFDGISIITSDGERRYIGLNWIERCTLAAKILLERNGIGLTAAKTYK